MTSGNLSMALINNLLPKPPLLRPQHQQPPPPLLPKPILPMLSGTNKTNSLLATSLVHFLSRFSLSPSAAPQPRIFGSVSNTTSLNSPLWAQSAASSKHSTQPNSALGVLGPVWCTTCNTNQHTTATCPHRYNGPKSFPSFARAQFM
ncbi:unnamed protein product [Prunus brigantina]